MAKHKPKAKGARVRITADDSKPNLFEKLYNRKKFDTLGRKAPGERKHGRSLHDAVEKRKETLLVEYKQLRKANAFVDRRFGESDDSLTAEEKAIARFQKQRMKEFAGDKFALNDEQDRQEDLLTHLGQSLGATDMHEGVSFQDDDADDPVNADFTEQFSFGGGLLAKKASDANPDGDPDRHRSKKEVMEEVMAKSKKHKAEKQHQREEDLNETEALDNQFKALMEGRLLASMVRAKTDKHRTARSKADDPESAAFDTMRRELIFDTKAQAGEKTRTAEDLAAAEQQRLQRLEAQRLKRLRGPSGDDLGEEGSPSEEEDGPAGGFALRRAKRRRREAEADEDDINAEDPLGSDASNHSSSEDEAHSGEDKVGDNSASDSDAEGGRLLKASLEARQAARAAGDHPLQQSFRAAAAQLLEKHAAAAGAKKQKKAVTGPQHEKAAPVSEGQRSKGQLEQLDKAAKESSSEDSQAEASQERAGVEADSEEDGSKEIGASDDIGIYSSNLGDSAARDEATPDKEELIDSGSELVDSQAEEESDSSAGSDGSSDLASSEDEGQEAPDALTDKAAPNQQCFERQQTNAAAHSSGRAHSTMQPAARAPTDEEDDLPYTIAAPATYAEFAQLVAPHSTGKLGLIIQRIRACNAIALATANRRKLQVFYGILVQHFANVAGASPICMEVLDVLTVHILELTAEVPFYAATVARARLLKAQKRLTAALTTSGSTADSCWPGARDVLLLKLWATVFPVSDRRHPVATPLALLAASYLTLCPVTCHRDAAVGLLLSSLALHMAAAGQRLVPEPLKFASTLLATALPLPVIAVAQSQQWLSPTGGWPSSSAPTPPLSMARVLESSPDDALFQLDTFRASLLQAALGVMTRAADVFADMVSFPELFGPASGTLAALQNRQKLPQDLQLLVEQLHSQVVQRSQRCIQQRQPLVRKAAKRVADVKQYTPQFEEEYVAGKDYDPDRERAEQKRLRRQVNKEKRGAMRELRKDAVFLSDEKDREKAQAKAERAGAYQKAMSFLQQQESDFKSGGQGGMWKKGKGKGKGR